MTDQDTKQLAWDIVNKAAEGKFLNFQYIRTWQEYRFYRQLKVSTKLVIKTLKTSASNLIKKHCKNIMAGISDSSLIFAYSQLLDIASFYEKDLATLQHMLDEYDEYLGQGNFWNSILGGYRSTWDKYC